MAWSVAAWDSAKWRDAAECRFVEPETFFPVGTSEAAQRQVARAKAVCAGCPVSQECLVFAVTTNQEYGVWGGLDEEERRDVRRSWRRQLRRVPAGADVDLDEEEPDEAALVADEMLDEEFGEHQQAG